MELNITQMINDDMRLLSGSTAELGDNAATYTWNNSQEYAREKPLLQPEQLEEGKRFFESMGCEDVKIEDVQTLMVQHVAHEIRELEGLTMEEYQEASDNGQVSGCIFQSDDKQFYIYIGE